MLITGYNKKRDQVINSVEKYLSKLESRGIIYGYSLDESGGMGSYETFYINFSLPVDDPEFEAKYHCKNTKSFEIRFSGHSGSYSNPDFALWNDDFKTVTELKKAILACINQQRKEEGLC